jgi:hypothetical protein
VIAPAVEHRETAATASATVRDTSLAMRENTHEGPQYDGDQEVTTDLRTQVVLDHFGGQV